MKKCLLFIFSLVYCSFSQAQLLDELEDLMPNEKENKVCTRAIERAEEDAKEGRYKKGTGTYYYYSSLNFDFLRYYDFYLEKHYKIESVNTHILYDSISCYLQSSSRLIRQQFGEDFYEQVRLAARKEFDENVDSSFVMSVYDQAPAFSNGKRKFHDALNRVINKEERSELQRKLVLELQIEVDGSISSRRVYRGLHEEYDQKILSALPLGESGTFVPAVYQGKKVRSFVLFPIEFRADY